MNRRNFLKIFGLASIGATVAYSFPSIIVLKNIIPVETSVISLEKLLNVYNTACINNSEPNLLLANQKTFNNVMNYIAPQMRWINDHGNIRFRNAEFKINEYLHDGEIISW